MNLPINENDPLKNNKKGNLLKESCTLVPLIIARILVLPITNLDQFIIRYYQFKIIKRFCLTNSSVCIM